MRRLLTRLASSVPAWVYRIRLPQRSFGNATSLRPIGARLSYCEDIRGIDVLEAFRRNTETVVDAIEYVGLEYFVTGWKFARPTALGMTATAAQDLVARLRSVGEKRPLYAIVRRPDGTSRTTRVDSTHDFQVSPNTTIGVFTPLHDPQTGRSFGSPYACNLEIWTDTGTLTRVGTTAGQVAHIEKSARSEPTTVEVDGRSLPTIGLLKKRRPFDVDFPVDAVYMWVNGDDREWAQRKLTRMADLDPGFDREGTAATRFVQYDELRFSLRSLIRNAPWIRRVFLVTDRQRPVWLDESGTNLTVIDHSEIMPTSALPTFNSHAIAANLHRIEGLADRFLVVNDDVMFGRPVSPDRFFHSNGVSRFFLSKTPMPVSPASSLEAARLGTCRIVERMTGRYPTRVFQHTPVAFNRELLGELWTELADEYLATTHSPFRSPTDTVIEYVHHYVGYARQLAMPGSIAYGYFGVGAPTGMRAMARYRSAAPTEVFCLNDHSDEHTDQRALSEAVTSFLDGQFPRPSPYETTAGETPNSKSTG